MKHLLRKSIGLLLFTGTLAASNVIFAQIVEVTKTTTTSEGTVSEFGPQSIFVKTLPGIKPIRYVFSETTNYVDEEGQPVAATDIKSDLPVTIYYTKVGDTLFASKVVVRKAPIAHLEPSETTWITSAGTISDFGPKTIVVTTGTSPDPLRYTHNKATTYVDEKGKAVSIETVKSGLPVTVFYTKVGDTMIASKVIVRSTVAVPVPVIEKKKTVITTITETNN
ncbi:hypothetical protein BH11VER1_BH11VER1_24160 [soil metagenome]